MTKAEKLFHKIAAELPHAKEGKMFGALCIKALNGKVAAMFWKDNMIFKLDGKAGQEALKLEGAHVGVHIYDHSKLMTGWVQIPFKLAAQWKKYSKSALANLQ